METRHICPAYGELTGEAIPEIFLEFPEISRAELGGETVADRPQDERGNSRIYDLIKHVPKDKEGKSPTLWAWPQVIGMFKVAGQPVPGPWPPHQEARPDPEAESTPVAVSEQQARRVSLPRRPTNG
jgi:hypothetical protein